MRTPLTTASTRPSSRVYRAQRCGLPRPVAASPARRPEPARSASSRSQAATTTRGMPPRSWWTLPALVAPRRANNSHTSACPWPISTASGPPGRDARPPRVRAVRRSRALVAAEKGVARLPHADLGLKPVVLVLADVRRVADDDVEARAAGHPVEQVALQKVDPAAEAQARRVAPGELQRRPLMSVATTRTNGFSAAAPGRRPDPVPTSSARRIPGQPASASRATSTSVSVSGRGTMPAGSKSTSMVRKALWPMI